MKKYALSIFLVLFLLSACKQEKKTPEGPSQMEQVMAIHDEVMPKMGTLGKLVGKLKSKVDTTETGVQYEAAMKDLQEANKAMMDWMMAFGNRFDSDEILDGKELTEEKQKWLDEEETKVKALKEQINSSIEKAEALLGKE
ncbi:hypothetical protein FVB32_06895 [Flagellimonas hymeniacidonis]|uniref:Viral A-type inclusion protein n=1 Tax=Flagellimonas hymeniacidonis TaxID=2603628 RepID=A0A5C8V9H3_9FLAO|nr:hypothetical protein [Flagellimonas hymeniacidonis]TXN38013.1 hypothetical protein FVB32_06895 [Flagellimonas hymeniacidonis]